MLLKWIFTLLAVWWLYITVRKQIMSTLNPPPPKPPPPETRVEVRKYSDDEGDYVDYEDVS